MANYNDTFQPKAGKVPAENNIVRLNVDSIRPVLVSELVIPSFGDIHLSQNLGAHGATQTFVDFQESDAFKDLRVGMTIVTAGFTQTDNNGTFVVTEIIDTNNVVVSGILGSGAVVDESGAGTMTVNVTPERLRHRGFFFADDVLVTFNNEPAKTLSVLAGESIFLTDSMVAFAVSADTVIYWVD